ncbi:MAG: phage holin family protein [Clostridiales bacterium]|jgi:toxin secretion/phage lysis holin|nr:phage holin family protein [Clostridiales bacterium]
MEILRYIKAVFFSVCGILASVSLEALGGYDNFLKTLIICMAIDIVSGWVVAAVFKKSAKTESGRLESGAGLKGLLKKGCMLLVIVIAVLLDDLMQTGGLTRDAVVIAFIVNELVSVIENMGLMGIKLPDALTDSVEALRNKKADKK